MMIQLHRERHGSVVRDGTGRPPVPTWLPVAVCLAAILAAAGVATAPAPRVAAPVAAAVVAGAVVLVRRVSPYGGPWALLSAGATAGVGSMVGSFSSAWLAVSLASMGLSVAAVVDVLERRVPTAVAHGTTGISVVAVAALVSTSDLWRDLALAVAATGLVVAVYAGLWLAHAVGFGDVRLAAATVTAAPAGVGYVSAMLLVPALVVGTVGLVQLAVRRRVSSSPMAPALMAGWLVAVGSLPP
jgi:leader peptidase (prepilin peptidase)/N-methyltransferase